MNKLKVKIADKLIDEVGKLVSDLYDGNFLSHNLELENFFVYKNGELISDELWDNTIAATGYWIEDYDLPFKMSNEFFDTLIITGLSDDDFNVVWEILVSRNFSFVSF